VTVPSSELCDIDKEFAWIQVSNNFSLIKHDTNITIYRYNVVRSSVALNVVNTIDIKDVISDIVMHNVSGYFKSRLTSIQIVNIDNESNIIGMKTIPMKSDDVMNIDSSSTHNTENVESANKHITSIDLICQTNISQKDCAFTFIDVSNDRIDSNSVPDLLFVKHSVTYVSISEKIYITTVDLLSRGSLVVKEYNSEEKIKWIISKFDIIAHCREER
jgi:hypothetical protein